MADHSKPPKAPVSLPPELPPELDTSWDDDTAPRLELDEPMSESAFDRVTAVPDLPAEQFAKQVMAQNAGRDSRPDVEPLGLPPLASQPPLISVIPGAAIDVRQHTPPASRRTAPASPGARADYEPVLELDLGEMARSAPPPALLVPSAPNSPRDASITEMKDRYAMGDFSGALVVAEGLIEADATDIDAQRYAQSCRDVLTQMYTSRLGALNQRVRVAVPGDQIRWLSLDHRAGFMLSLVDGSCTVEELLDISGMNRLDALRILFTLYDQRVIALS